MGTFERFAPFIQNFIYDHEWESLRGIQVAAAEAIFDTDANVLLTAQTASGKTEAAFFPILSLFDEDPPASVGAIYIGPLKALINDQFLRLNDLCAEANIPVWHWHGDVSASHKAKMLKNPSGILQITPESLEALLLRKHAAISRLFCDLRFIVIDEVHSLLRGDRGGQTICLIERLVAWRASTRGASACPPPSETRRPWAPSSPLAPAVAGSLPASKSRSAPGVSPWNTLPQRPPGGRRHGRAGRGGPARHRLHSQGQGADAKQARELALQSIVPDEVEEPTDHAASPALDAPSDTAPREADPGLGYIFYIRATRSASSLPTRARTPRPSARGFAAIVRPTTRQTAFSSITATSRAPCASLPRSS